MFFLFFFLSLHEKPPFLNLLQLLWKPCVTMYPSPVWSESCSDWWMFCRAGAAVEVCSYCCTLEGKLREQAGKCRKRIHLIDPTSENSSSLPQTDAFGGGSPLVRGSSAVLWQCAPTSPCLSSSQPLSPLLHGPLPFYFLQWIHLFLVT